jgi:hypothetical protein
MEISNTPFDSLKALRLIIRSRSVDESRKLICHTRYKGGRARWAGQMPDGKEA